MTFFLWFLLIGLFSWGLLKGGTFIANKLLFPQAQLDEAAVQTYLKHYKDGAYNIKKVDIRFSGQKVPILISRPDDASTPIEGYVIVSHGNACHMYGVLSSVHRIANELHKAVILYDYPGYGNTLGVPTEEGCCTALRQVLYFFKSPKSAPLRQDLGLPLLEDATSMLMGQSLGTGVTVKVATSMTPPWRGPLVLISPYLSIVKVITEKPHRPWWLALGLKVGEVTITPFYNPFPTHTYIEQVEGPIHFYHGLQDRLIHPSHSQSLSEKRGEDKGDKLTLLHDVDHGNVLAQIHWKRDFEI